MKVINEAFKSAVRRGLPNSLKPLIHSFIKRTTTDKEELPLCCRLQGYLFNPLRKQSGGKNTQEGRHRERVSAVSGASRSRWQWGVLQLVISSRSQLSMNAGRESRSCLCEVRLGHTQTPYHSRSHTHTHGLIHSFYSLFFSRLCYISNELPKEGGTGPNWAEISLQSGWGRNTGHKKVKCQIERVWTCSEAGQSEFG